MRHACGIVRRRSRSAVNLPVGACRHFHFAIMPPPPVDAVPAGFDQPSARMAAAPVGRADGELPVEGRSRRGHTVSRGTFYLALQFAKKGMARIRPMVEYEAMAEEQDNTIALASVAKIQKEWFDLTLRVAQAETERGALEAENKALRALLERVIEHRQKSHSELVTILTTLVSKLPLNDVGIIVARLMEHNQSVAAISASLIKGKLDDNFLQPAILKNLDKTKRDLADAAKVEVEKLLKLDTTFESDMLQSLLVKPDNFFSPAMARANRGFVKGQLPRERILRDFGADALVFFKDVTTDVKFNPRPKPEEIMLAFKPEFAELVQQNPTVAADRRKELESLQRKTHQCRENTDQSRAQKNAFVRLSFFLELLHYYENQSTESPDVVFAQRLPPLIEQLVITGESDTLDEKHILAAEALLALILNADHRKAVVNNIGKAGGLPRTLRYTLAFRAEQLTDMDPLTLECVKHLIPRGQAPAPAAVTIVLRLFNPHMQQALIRAIMATDRLNKEDAEKLGKAVASELGLKAVLERLNEQTSLTPERERQLAWDHIKDLIGTRASPNEIIATIRKRLHGRYEADEVKACWLVLTEADAMVFVRVFCLFPYMPDGQADPLARPILETFVNRLTHEKYAATYTKVIAALKNLYKVKADSPAIINFVALVKWVDTEAATRLAKDLGMTA
jgi:hypothetical protein